MSTITDAVVPHGVGRTFVTDDYFVTDAYLTGLFGTCRFIGSGHIILHKNVKRMEMAEKMSEVVDGRGGGFWCRRILGMYKYAMDVMRMEVADDF